MAEWKGSLFPFCNIPSIPIISPIFLDNTMPRHFYPTSLFPFSQQQNNPLHQDEK